MQDLPNIQFIDDDIKRALRVDAPSPSREQMLRARERLLEAAEEQTALPVETNSSGVRQQIETVFRLLISDAAMYERARDPADVYRHYLSAHRFSFYRLAA